MRKHLRLAAVFLAATAVVLGAVVPAGLSAPAQTACPRTATIAVPAGTTVADYDFHSGYTTDPSVHYGDPLAGTTISKGHGYLVTGGTATVRSLGATFEVASGSYVALSCSSQTKGSPAVGTLWLAAGKITVHDPQGNAGAVTTNEGLYGPVPGNSSALTFTVQRTSAKKLDGGDMLAMFLGSWYAKQTPRGVTRIQAGGASLVNVTPYVGPRIGSCRHARGASLSSLDNSAHYSGVR